MRVATIDPSSETTVAACHRCQWRTIGTEEVSVRRSLLRHHIEVHEADKVTRDSMHRWFQRKGIRTA
jgi:predicted small metal-binding protein